MGALCTFDYRLRAMGNNYHEVHITVVSRRTPCVGTEHPNLLRLEFGLKSFNCGLQETGWNQLHNVETNTMDIDLKARSSLEMGDR
jgi:hypothetical protein